MDHWTPILSLGSLSNALRGYIAFYHMCSEARTYTNSNSDILPLFFRQWELQKVHVSFSFS